MEIQLQELIDRIKKDGVQVAETEAADILQAANAQAEKIISDAKAQAEKMLLDAKEQNKRMVSVSEDAIRQAGRNMLISFRESVAKELNAVVGEKVAAAYSPDALSALIINVVDAWTKNADTDDIAVILSNKDLSSLQDGLLAALKEKLLTGVTLKSSDSFDGGFRIAVNGGKAYYDYSTEAVMEMLSAYLNPKVTALMKEAEGI